MIHDSTRVSWYRLFLMCCLFGFLNSRGMGQPVVQMTKVTSVELTPTATHTTGTFCRIFYHPVREKFYLTHTGVQVGAPDDIPSYQDLVYHEYDENFNFTGNTGIFPNLENGISDYAMVYTSGHYYLLMGALSGYAIMKYKDNFQFVDSVHVVLTQYDHNNDMMLNFTRGNLYLSSVYDTSQTQNFYTHQHLLVYDTSLNKLDDRIIWDVSYMASGASLIFNQNRYHVVTGDWIGSYEDPSTLSVYQFSPDWTFLGSIVIDKSGQWSQGLLFDNGFYYVAFHTPGIHGPGNIAVCIYNLGWNLIHKEMVTDYSAAGNQPTIVASRPSLVKVGDRLYVTYDIESFDPQTGGGRDWQAVVVCYQIEFIDTGVGQSGNKISERNSPVSVFPNPTNSYLVIEFDNPVDRFYDIELVSLLGEKVWRKGRFAGEQLTINTTEFASGIYFIRIMDDLGRAFLNKVTILK